MRDVRVAAMLGAAAIGAAIAATVLLSCHPQRRRRPAVGSRVVFLDIDGVVNRTKRADQIILEPDLVALLRQIIEETGAQIVLSTFWKPFDDYVAYALHRVGGLDGALVVGATPGSSVKTCVQRSSASHLLHGESLGLLDGADHGGPAPGIYPNRAAEIRHWLARHPQVTHYAILDDRADAADGELLPSFVRTDPAVGLTEGHVARAVTLLREARS